MLVLGPGVVVKAAAWKVGDRGFEPLSGSQVSKKKNVSSLFTRKNSILLEASRDRELASSNSDRQGSNFESCVWRAVSSHSSHHPQEVLLTHFSLYMHKGGLKPRSFKIFYAMLFQSWFTVVDDGPTLKQHGLTTGAGCVDDCDDATCCGRSWCLWLETQRWPTRFDSPPGRMFVIEVVHKQCSKLFKGILSMVLCTIKETMNKFENSTVEHSPDFRLLSVAILPCFCTKRRTAIFTHWRPVVFLSSDTPTGEIEETDVWTWPGQVRNLTCMSRGLPKPTINWIRQGEYLDNSQYYHIIHQQTYGDTTRSILTVSICMLIFRCSL